MTHFHGNLYSRAAFRGKSNRNSGLRDAGVIDLGRFHFAVKIDFEGQRCGVEDCAAVLAIAEVTLDFSPNFGRQPAF
jgi:hypothetical protein